MTAHASTLVIAGGETVATFLSAATYHLLRTPTAYRTLVAEIRTTFPTYESITVSSCLQLPYLQAVISEGLRIYPPGSQGFPRVSPGMDVGGIWVPKGVCIILSILVSGIEPSEASHAVKASTFDQTFHDLPLPRPKCILPLGL